MKYIECKILKQLYKSNEMLKDALLLIEDTGDINYVKELINDNETIMKNSKENKERKLISTADFVLEQEKLLDIYINHDKGVLFERSAEHAKKLKRELKKSMFVPTDEDGDVLKEQPEYCFATEGSNHYIEHKKYWEAKEQVIFEGFESYFEDGVINIKLGVIIKFGDTTTIMRVGELNNFNIVTTVEDLIEYDLIINDNF